MKITEFKRRVEPPVSISTLTTVSFRRFIVSDQNFLHLVSLAGLALITILLLFELRSFMTPHYQEHMVVDTTILSDKLTINVNITFHALSCNEAHLDVMDVAGDNQLNVEHDMSKQRLDKHGRRIGKSGIEIIGEGKLPIPNDLPPDYCGSCYGAETLTRKCCNTCDDLLRAYQEHQW